LRNACTTTADPTERPRRGPGPAAVELLQWHLANYAAVEAGKAYLVPEYGPHPEPSPALAAIMLISTE